MHRTGKAAGKRPRKRLRRRAVANPSQIVFVLLAHLSFVVLVGGVLLTALAAVRFVGYPAGVGLVVLAGLTLIVQYQRVAAGPAWLASRLCGGSRAGAELPESYVAALSIGHFVPLLVLLQVVDGSLWLRQHPVTRLSTPEEVLREGPEGVYNIEDTLGVSSMRYRHYGRGTPRSTQEQKYSDRDPRVSWDVLPLVSSQSNQSVPSSQDELRSAVSSGRQCVWLGSKNGSRWIVDRLPASENSAHFVERGSRDARKYLDVLESNLGQPASCARILEKMPPPEVVQGTYLRWSLIALGLAHGVPAVLLVVFSVFSGVSGSSVRRGREAP